MLSIELKLVGYQIDIHPPEFTTLRGKQNALCRQKYISIDPIPNKISPVHYSHKMLQPALPLAVEQKTSNM